jgi:hypothetical protein
MSEPRGPELLIVAVNQSETRKACEQTNQAAVLMPDSAARREDTEELTKHLVLGGAV